MRPATSGSEAMKCAVCGAVVYVITKNVVCFNKECGLYDHCLTRPAYKVLSDMRDKITNQKAALKEAIEWIDDGADSGDLRPCGGFIEHLYDLSEGKENK